MLFICIFSQGNKCLARFTNADDDEDATSMYRTMFYSGEITSVSKKGVMVSTGEWVRRTPHTAHV